MLIKRIKAVNYKTYLNLDLDLSVDPERPIILIGGKNGGGKTTLFEAICGALYGLKIKSKREFEQLLNDGAGKNSPEIILELLFTGQVLNQEQWVNNLNRKGTMARNGQICTILRIFVANLVGRAICQTCDWAQVYIESSLLIAWLTTKLELLPALTKG